jgi:pimeloyl-ACP methyl ester carboxylesterase
VNTNTSKLACPTDGKPYRIVGELVAPQALLASASRSVTLYLHGVEITDGYFHLQVAGYDFVTELARLGHASAIIDRLGFGASGRPNGAQACVGGDADIAHQIVSELRRGRYRTNRHAATSFGRIGLAGHSGGGPIAEAEAYSYRDTDALIVMGWQDGTASAPTLQAAATGEAPRCAIGGFPTDGPNPPSGYAYLWPSARQWAHDTTYNIDPAVLRSMSTYRRRTPCGELESDVTASSVFASSYSGAITRPVLLMYADQDALYPASSGPEQRARFTASRDLTLDTIHGAGHVFFIEKIAPAVRTTLSDWLTRHRL